MHTKALIAVATLSGLLAAGCGGGSGSGGQGSAPPGPAAIPEQIAEGKGLYQANCAACHGDDGSRSKPNLADASWQAKASDAEMFAAIRDGKGVMPGFKDRLTEEQTAATVAYVRSLASTGE